MGNLDNSEAFLRAFETSDCEALQNHIRNWFEVPYRTPENTIDIAAVMHSAMIAALTAREEECRAKWRDAEAERWHQARQTFDAGMCAFLEAITKQPKPDPYQGERDERKAAPSIGRGWRIPTTGKPQARAQFAGRSPEGKPPSPLNA